MGNSQIRLLKCSKILKLFSIEVCFYQIYKCVTLEKNIRQKLTFLGFKNDSFWFVFALYFNIGYLICMFDKIKFLQNTILNRWNPLRLS